MKLFFAAGLMAILVCAQKEQPHEMLGLVLRIHALDSAEYRAMRVLGDGKSKSFDFWWHESMKSAYSKLRKELAGKDGWVPHAKDQSVFFYLDNNKVLRYESCKVSLYVHPGKQDVTPHPGRAAGETTDLSDWCTVTYIQTWMGK